MVRIRRAPLKCAFPMLLAGNGREPLEKTGAHGRRARLFGGACENDLGRAHALCEIMRREADTLLWQIETEFEPHRSAKPWIAAGIGWPGAFVESAKHNPIRALQPCLEQPQDTHTRITAFRAPFSAARAKQMENVRIVRRGKYKLSLIHI